MGLNMLATIDCIGWIGCIHGEVVMHPCVSQKKYDIKYDKSIYVCMYDYKRPLLSRVSHARSYAVHRDEQGFPESEVGRVLPQPSQNFNLEDVEDVGLEVVVDAYAVHRRTDI